MYLRWENHDKNNNIVCTWPDIERNTKANQFADERTIQNIE